MLRPMVQLGVLCAISKEHYRRNRTTYWFAFHPAQKAALKGFQKELVAFGCCSEHKILAIPLQKFLTWLPLLNKTELEDRFYWHVHLTRLVTEFGLDTKREHENVIVSEFLSRSVAGDDSLAREARGPPLRLRPQVEGAVLYLYDLR